MNDGQEPLSISYIRPGGKDWPCVRHPFISVVKFGAAPSRTLSTHMPDHASAFRYKHVSHPQELSKKQTWFAGQWICFPRSLLGLPSQWNHYLQFLKCQGTWRSVEIRVGSCSVGAGSLWEPKFWTKADCFWKACLASTAIIVPHPSWLDECKFKHA